MRKIVGAKIEDLLTNNSKTIIYAMEHNMPIEFLDQERMQFMAACDLGPQWTAMGNWPVMFLYDEEKGAVYPPRVNKCLCRCSSQGGLNSAKHCY